MENSKRFAPHLGLVERISYPYIAHAEGSVVDADEVTDKVVWGEFEELGFQLFPAIRTVNVCFARVAG